MPTIAEMTSGTAAITITFNRLSVQAEYYPGRVTERTIQRIRGMAQASSDDGVLAGFADMNALLVDLVASWDLTEADGVTMFPLDAERLAEVPVQFRANALTAILNNMRPNE